LNINHSEIFILSSRKIEPITKNFQGSNILWNTKIIFICPSLALFLRIYTNLKPISNPYEIIFITPHSSRLTVRILNNFNFVVKNIKQKRSAPRDINPPWIACRILEISRVSKFFGTIKSNHCVQVSFNEGNGFIVCFTFFP